MPLLIGSKRILLANAYYTGGGVAPSGPQITTGDTYVMSFDGVGQSDGVRRIPLWIMSGLKGRMRPTVCPIASLSGTTIARVDGSNTPFITPVAIPGLSAQYPDVFIFGSCGANDNLLSVNPVGNVFMQDWKDAVSLTVSSNPQAQLIVVGGTAPSIKTDEPTWRTAAWAQQAAHVASLNDDRVIFVDVSSIDPNNWSPASDSGRVHPDERGAQAYANLILAAIEPYLEVKTQAEVLDMIFGNTYPGATQLATDRALVGTGGTVTNMVGGSNAPTSKLATNLTGSTGISSAVAAIAVGQKLEITLGGTVTAEGKVMVQDKSNVLIAATPGQIAISGMVVRASAGFVNAGADLGSFGSVGGGANSLGPSVGVTAPVANPVDSIWMPFPIALRGGTIPYPAKRAFAFNYPAGAVAGEIETEQWFYWIPNDRQKGAPVYIGGYSIVATLSKMRVTGTIAAGFRLEPGTWNMGGLTEADFVQRRIYKGGDGTVGSGTLVATMSGSTWTTAANPAGVVAGDVLWAEVDCNNGIGPTVTGRASVGFVAA